MADDVRIDDRLREWLATARAHWPEITAVAEHAFAEHLRERLTAAGGALDDLRAADLYLAFACARGDKHALRCFERQYLGPLDRALARFGGGPGFVDDVTQQLRVRLLVGPPPRIAEYNGRGSLEAWVRIAAVRLAVDLKRRVHPTVSDEDSGVAVLASAGDPELEVIKARFQDDFRVVLREAFGALDATQRRLLRFYVVDRMNIGEIGAVVGLSRATVARRIADCRTAILEDTKQRLKARLGVKPSELSSLIRMAQSQLDMSLSKLLRSSP